MGIDAGKLSGPTRLFETHDIDDFSSGDDELDAWLTQTAMKAEKLGTARTYVVCDGKRVVAYYCLSNATVARDDLAKRRQRGMPRHVPAALIGRLAFDHRYQRQGIGRHLVKDAMGRVLSASEIMGIVALHLHASSPTARAFYLALNLGFEESPTVPLTLFLPVATIRHALLPEE